MPTSTALTKGYQTPIKKGHGRIHVHDRQTDDGVRILGKNFRILIDQGCTANVGSSAIKYHLQKQSQLNVKDNHILNIKTMNCTLISHITND